jgi:hypothetical protein
MAFNDSYKDSFDDRSRTRQRQQSSHAKTPYLGTNILKGVALQCQFCSGQAFRRSTLRGEDLTQLLLMRYPVRCLRCSQRQGVSFTVAGISLSSKIRPQRPTRKPALDPTPPEPVKVPEASHE